MLPLIHQLFVKTQPSASKLVALRKKINAGKPLNKQDLKAIRHINLESVSNHEVLAAKKLIRRAALNKPIKKTLNDPQKKRGYRFLAGADLSGVRWLGLRLPKHSDLSWANLAGANLLWANLAGANIAKATLKEAKLAGANLIGTKLTGTNLSGANLSWANLTRANLTGAYLTRANLTGAYLTQTDFTHATLIEANLSGNLHEAKIHTGVNFTNATFSPETQTNGLLLDEVIVPEGSTQEQFLRNRGYDPDGVMTLPMSDVPIKATLNYEDTKRN
ncbi:MAG: pentapeptide repeat-containing protein [Vampirovibrionales bacterium]|nr:pentapeptide repeat-containing protein [Vampirovibrionales bacterium]